MKTSYVNHKSELTARKQAMEADGFEVYRSRLYCHCAPARNRRHGILVIHQAKLVEKVLVCKECAKGGAAW